MAPTSIALAAGTAAVTAAAALTAAALGGPATGPAAPHAADRDAHARVVPLKDARLKFEINATDGDGGVQAFIDADGWRRMTIFDPSGRRVLHTRVEGRMAAQGGTELFLESSEPPFAELPLRRLLARFPEGRYAFRGVGLSGERLAGSARLTHDIPAGPELVTPLPAHGAQPVDGVTVTWRPVPPAGGSPIIGYQVLVVRPVTGLRALPKVTLDVTMPPSATSLRVPPGFLAPSTEYEWEVLAIERGGNQTLSSSAFTTAP